MVIKSQLDSLYNRQCLKRAQQNLPWYFCLSEEYLMEYNISALRYDLSRLYNQAVLRQGGPLVGSAFLFLLINF